MRRNAKVVGKATENIKVVTPPPAIETIKPFKKPNFAGNRNLQSGQKQPGSGTSVNTVVVGGFIN